MDKMSVVLSAIAGALLLILVLLIGRSIQTMERTEMAVIRVDYDKFRQCTFVYDASGYKAFAGLHYDIKVGSIYTFTYKRGILWSHLIEFELVRPFDLVTGGIS